MNTYVIANFYKFVPLEDYEALKPTVLAGMKSHGVLGTLILAQEGINGGFAGLPVDVQAFIDFLRQDVRFSDVQFQMQEDNFMPFEKAKVKLRNEIVTLGVPGINPGQDTGERVAPEAWNDLITDPDVILIDTRNDYETEIGTFKGAIAPKTENFRDFPAYVQQHLIDKKDKKIAMCCTGGIRCEKSTAYLRALGFSKVYQLEGGILNYLKSVPNASSLWQGQCFVFDERIAISAME